MLAGFIKTVPKSRGLFLVLVISALAACAAAPEQKPSDGMATKSSDVSAASEKVDQTTKQDTVPTKQISQGTAAMVNPAGKESAIKTQQPVQMVKSCKDEPYVKYEKASLASMEKGLAATKEKKYGVGFRSINEYKKWHDIHDKLFARVNESCSILKQCIKQNPKDKSKKCAKEASAFNEWQNMAKRFTAKVKMVESTQPDEICSFEPNLKDVPQCFHTLAENVNKVCDSAKCKELSSCWSDVGYQYDAMKQAEQACGFVHKALSDCGAYTLAKSRREKRFSECEELQSEVDIVKFPAL